MRTFVIELPDSDAVAFMQGRAGPIEMIGGRCIREILGAEDSAKPPYHVPGPYEIALALGSAMAGSGRYDTPGAALQAAWAAVPEFFAGRDFYLREIVPAIAAASQDPAYEPTFDS